jgi:hypothetical protein
MEPSLSLRIYVLGSDRTLTAQVLDQAPQALDIAEEPRQLTVEVRSARFLPIKLWEENRLVWDGTVFLEDQTEASISFRIQEHAHQRVAYRIATAAPATPDLSSAQPWVFPAWGGLLFLYLIGLWVIGRKQG